MTLKKQCQTSSLTMAPPLLPLLYCASSLLGIIIFEAASRSKRQHESRHQATAVNDNTAASSQRVTETGLSSLDFDMWPECPQLWWPEARLYAHLSSPGPPPTHARTQCVRERIFQATTAPDIFRSWTLARRSATSANLGMAVICALSSLKLDGAASLQVQLATPKLTSSIFILQRAGLGGIAQRKWKELHGKDKCLESDGRGPAPSEPSVVLGPLGRGFGAVVRINDGFWLRRQFGSPVGERTVIGGRSWGKGATGACLSVPPPSIGERRAGREKEASSSVQ
ncbi:hypothetical protein B0T09DRAFT_375405 [Sordaria sp. MPI-SDFR-AT-0083]|nr:hypothetical protein B0T09DRAFT_375405 [Sordaria sp. MPI-SDFR-AT-0083]